MEATALVLLASGVGVMFGWQPMSDGSPRYEYIVQLEPELVATLKEGQSIPISSDVPDDIQPVGRIRIVVGRQALPRQLLTAQLKPLAETAKKKSLDGVIPTQHRVPPVQPTQPGLFGSGNSQPILPPGNAQNAAGQNLPPGLSNISQPGASSQIFPPQGAPAAARSAQDATQALGSQLRNIGQAVRTDTEQFFGTSDDHSDSGPQARVADAANQVTRQTQQGIQGAAQQLQRTVEDLGQSARQTVDQFGQWAYERSILQSGQPPTQPSSGDQAILPPPGESTQQQAGGPHDPQRQRLDQPVDLRRREDWQAPRENGSREASLGNTSPGGPDQRNDRLSAGSPGTFNPNWPPAAGEENQWLGDPNRLPPPPGLNSSPRSALAGDNPHDRSNTTPAPDSRPSTPASGGGRYNTADNRQVGPQFPNGRQAPSPSFADDTTGPQRSDTATTENNWAASTATTPTIRRDMLDSPPDAELQTAGSQPVASSAAQAHQPPGTRQPQATDFGWDRSSESTAPPHPAPDEGSKSLFPLLLSWVLLSGSGAGNLYLFWSYLDVRHKYRGVVHNARGGAGPRL